MTTYTNISEAGDYEILMPPYIYLTELVFGIVGTLGNLSVIIVVLSTAKMRTLTNYLILNLAVADFFVSFLLIVNKYVTQAFYIPVPGGSAGIIYCRLYYSAVFFWVCIKASTFNLLLMTYETYVAVVHPLVYPAYRTKRNIISTVAVSWILSLLIELVFVQYHGKADDGDCYLFVYSEPAVGVFLGVFNFVVTFLLPMILLAWACFKIQRRLGAKISNIGDGTSIPQSETNLRARRRVVKTLYLVILCYAVCWTPDSFLFLCVNVGVSVEYTATYFNALVLLAFANSILNPIIYIFKYRQFRMNFLRTFCWCLTKNSIGPKSTGQDSASMTGGRTNPPNVVPAVAGRGGHI
ncbi:tachykinin-like peptides receptor 99D [Ptychodera flava]|uniref:tachykinin-like peptides receptor 99D n=1 Tax=Ptychodera flava TaxID=63121 RepID=UPI00396A2F49